MSKRKSPLIEFATQSTDLLAEAHRLLSLLNTLNTDEKNLCKICGWDADKHYHACPYRDAIKFIDNCDDLIGPSS